MSNEADATPESDASEPEAPQSLSAQGSNTQVDLTWSAPSSDGGAAIEDYNIYRGSTSGSLSYYDNVAGTATIYQDTGLSNGTTYYYSVAAVNSVGEGSQSSEVHATPLQIGELVSVPSGSFEMGSNVSDEQPVHSVDLSAYRIGKYEVTNQQYADVLNYAVNQEYLENSSGDAYSGGTVYLNGYVLIDVSSSRCEISYDAGEFSVGNREGYPMENHPVTEISWHGAVAYTNWLSESQSLTPCYDLSSWERESPVPNGYRLPTEAEWERAAAWDSDTSKHWTYCFQKDSISANDCNYDGVNPLGLSDYAYTTPVGYYDGSGSTEESTSPVGCYDMSGNLWELVHDLYLSDYYGISPSSDPAGPTTGTSFVLRGGHWGSTFPFCRTVDRDQTTSLNHYSYRYGFRLAQTE